MDTVKDLVRASYGSIAAGSSCCTPSCCGDSKQAGYSDTELASLPEGANWDLGCGNPQAIAGLKPGETVVDLGSRAGSDCFLAAQQVGPTCRAFGVDMTHKMRRQHRRRHLVQLRDQRDAGQSAGLSGGVSRPQTRRAAGDFRRRQCSDAAGRVGLRPRVAPRLRVRRGTGAADRGLAGRGGICGRLHGRSAAKPRPDRGLGAGDGGRGLRVSATIEARKP
jgi:hypothetical protein